MKSIKSARIHVPAALFGNSGKVLNRHVKKLAALRVGDNAKTYDLRYVELTGRGVRPKGFALGQLVTTRGIHKKLVCFGPCFPDAEAAINWAQNRKLGTPTAISENVVARKAA